MLSMDKNQYDSALRVIHTWAAFEVERVSTHGIDATAMINTLRNIANKTAMLLERDDLVIRQDDQA
jgi:hypothetical protein